MIPTDPDARDALAAEYVLGTLEAREATAVAAALPSDPALAAAVAAWEARLAPLADLATPEAPPPALWSRIEAALDPAPAEAPARRKDPGHDVLLGLLRLWRRIALGFTGVVAFVAVVVVVLRPAPEQPSPQQPPQRLITVLMAEREQPAWLVQADQGGLRLASLNSRPVPPGRVLQLWALPAGETAPTSLGLIPAAGQVNVALRRRPPRRRHAELRASPWSRRAARPPVAPPAPCSSSGG